MNPTDAEKRAEEYADEHTQNADVWTEEAINQHHAEVKKIYLAGHRSRDAEVERLNKVVAVLMGACKTGVGYEPLMYSLEPRKFSDALAKAKELGAGE